jgi:hypothetical protein
MIVLDPGQKPQFPVFSIKQDLPGRLRVHDALKREDVMAPERRRAP